MSVDIITIFCVFLVVFLIYKIFSESGKIEREEEVVNAKNIILYTKLNDGTNFQWSIYGDKSGNLCIGNPDIFTCADNKTGQFITNNHMNDLNTSMESNSVLHLELPVNTDLPVHVEYQTKTKTIQETPIPTSVSTSVPTSVPTSVSMSVPISLPTSLTTSPSPLTASPSKTIALPIMTSTSPRDNNISSLEVPKILTPISSDPIIAPPVTIAKGNYLPINILLGY